MNEPTALQQPPDFPDFRTTNSLHASRASVLAANRFQQGLSSTPPLIRSQFDEQHGEETGEEQNEEQQQAQLLAGIQAARTAQAAGQAQAQQSEQENKKTSLQQEEVKKTAKAAVRRGAIFVLNSIASAIDLGSSGVTFIIDIFIYIFTLGYLNLEMIYGGYLMKGKSKYIGPLSWAPIPMPIDKNGVLLIGFVVAADIALAIAIPVFLFGSMCIIYDSFILVTPITAFAAGISLAQGGTGGLCSGTIISTMLSF